MFGRTRKQVDDDVIEDDTDDTENQESEPAEDEVEDDQPDDEWSRFDASRDWREDGPFDITEVDLDADDVQRLDFGSLIVTPFDGMQLQMQISQASKLVQALLVVAKEAALEVALFAAPARGSMLAQVRSDMEAATEQAEGTMTLTRGPLGTEVRRVLPVTAPDGRTGKQASRTWMVQGPKWLLRGVLLGKGATEDAVTGDSELLFEFFCNLVVRRGDTPHVPGELIGLEVPAALAATLEEQAAKAAPASA